MLSISDQAELTRFERYLRAVSANERAGKSWLRAQLYAYNEVYGDDEAMLAKQAELERIHQGDAR